MPPELNMLRMSVEERKLFTRTREYIDLTCPGLKPKVREQLIAKVYAKMHFVTKMSEAE